MMYYVVVSLTSRKNFFNYIVGLLAAYFVGFLFLVFLPTYMDRAVEGLTSIPSDGNPINFLLNLVFENDGDSFNRNLFPSYHCMISMYCYLGVRKQPEIAKPVRIGFLVLAVLISASTVLVKQHYIIDIPSAWLVAIGCYAVVNKINPAERLRASFKFLQEKD